MLQTYQGYFQDGQFFDSNNTLVKVPEKRLTIINILEDIMPDGQEHNTTAEDEIAERLAMFKSLKGIIPSDTDFDAVKAERIAKRGLMDA